MAVKIWSPSPSLSPRVKRLREEYFSFEKRTYYRNEVIPFTTGKPWDVVWSPHNWGVVPEMIPFFAAYQDSLLAAARVVPLPLDFWKEPLIVRRAIFFKEVISKHLPVKILDGELIVGAYFNTALSKTHTEAEARRWRTLEEKWLNELKRLNSHGVGNCGAIPGHIIPNYPKVLRLGFKGIKEELEAMLPSAKGSKRDFLRALIICCEAVPLFTARYAEEAERLASEESDPLRRGELLEIARICRKVPWEPAETFHEALQSLWFTHSLVMVAESYPGPGLSPGRIDQYLYPYYKADLDSGRLTREKAKELLQCYWIKHNYAYDYQGRVGTNQGINSGFGQLITLGGIGPDGHDASNELTWLILEVIEEMNLLEPKPNIRLHAGTPEPLLMRVAEMIARAQGSPFLLNFDEASMRGLEWEGLPKEKLWDYAPVGCLENTLQGCDRSGTVDVNLNLAKAVELTLNNGRDFATGEQIGPRTGDPRNFATWDDFYSAFKLQLKSILQQLISCNNLADQIRAELEPTPYLSLLVDGCAEKGLDVTQGGAKYNFITINGVAFATAVDSLAAVKKLVYEEKKVKMDELVQAIAANFEGYEPLRRMLIEKAPKYGNDDPYVDELARDVSRFWTEEAFKHTTPTTGKRYRGGYLSWNYWIAYAPSTAATPDGRKRGTFLSNGLCPVNGADRKGPTAVIRSVGSLGLETAPSGASHIITLSPSILRDAEHIKKLAALLRAYGRIGGTSLMVNVIDAETLREAQRNPEEYRNLLVRVTGYNAYFVMLGKEIQDEIIARVSHEL